MVNRIPGLVIVGEEEDESGRETSPIPGLVISPGKKQKKPSAIKELGRGFVEGLMSTPESAGTVAKIAGAEEVGKAIEEKSRAIADKYRMPDSLQGSVVENPSLLAKPAWWTHGIGQMAGSMVGPAGVGGGAFKIGSGILKKVITDPKTVAKAAKYIGIGAGGAAGGTMEGTSTYNQVLDETGDEQKALRSGTLMAVGSAVLNSASFGSMLSPKTKSKLLHAITAGITEGATEQAEEPWEAIVMNKPEEAAQRWIDGFNVFLPAMVTGGLGGLGGSVLSSDERAELRDALKKTSDLKKRTGIIAPDLEGGGADLAAEMGEDGLDDDEHTFLKSWLDEEDYNDSIERRKYEAQQDPEALAAIEEEELAHHEARQKDAGDMLKDRLATEEANDYLRQEEAGLDALGRGLFQAQRAQNDLLGQVKAEEDEDYVRMWENLDLTPVSRIIENKQEILMARPDITPAALNDLIIKKQAEKLSGPMEEEDGQTEREGLLGRNAGGRQENTNVIYGSQIIGDKAIPVEPTSPWRKLASSSITPEQEVLWRKAHDIFKEADTRIADDLRKEYGSNLRLIGKAENGSDVILTPSARNEGKHQFTYFTQDGIPAGHEEYDTPQEGIRAFMEWTRVKRPDLHDDFLLSPDTPREYVYESRLRPLGPGAAPKENLVGYENGGQFGRAVYSFPLTEEQIEHFSFTPIESREPSHPEFVHKTGMITKNDQSKIVNETHKPKVREPRGVANASKVATSATRFRPKEMVQFKTPLLGKSGAKLSAYEWKWKPEEIIDKFGEEKTKRISDWDEAVSSAETGKDIVHQFQVEMPDGTTKMVSAESVMKLLGYTNDAQGKALPSLVNASKTLAKNKMQLAILEDQQAAKNTALKDIRSNGYPEPISEPYSDGKTKWKMGDSYVIQWTNPDVPIEAERLSALRDAYERDSLNNAGIDTSNRSYVIDELKSKIARQEKRIDDILNASNAKTAQPTPINQPSNKLPEESQPVTPSKPKNGWAWINEQQRPFTEWKEVIRGRNKGKVVVTVAGKKHIIDKGKVRAWPEEAKPVAVPNDESTARPVASKEVQGRPEKGEEVKPLFRRKEGDDVRFSLKTLDEWSKKAAKAAEKQELDPDEVLKDLDQIRRIGEILNRKPGLLREEGSRNPVRSNMDYIKTVDFNTNCPRRMQYAANVKEIERRLGRPMMSDELIGMSVKMLSEGKVAPCLYCYVEAGRRAFNDAILKFSKDHKGFNTDGFTQWWTEKLEGHDISSQFLKRDLASFEKARAYAQASSMANVSKGFDAYRGQILNIRPRTMEQINGRAGMRFNSNTDFQVDQTVDYMQAITDLAIIGSKAHAYTKEPSFAKIFGKTGMRINQSVFAREVNGKVVEDAQQGMPWKAARENAAVNPKDVGTIMVVTSDNQLNWALEQPWIDMIIPFHRSGMTEAQYDSLGFEDYQSTQSEEWIEPKKHTGEKAPHFKYDQHRNNKAKYLKLCKDAGVHPRFREYVEHKNYMKLITDTVKAEIPQKPVKAQFDYEAAERTIKQWQKEGGYTKKEQADKELVDSMVSRITNGGIRLRLENRATGLPLQSIQQAIDPITSKWKNAPAIKVVQSISELPDEIRKQITGGDVVGGAFYNDTVYLVADGTDSVADAQKTILHETIAHWGLRKTFGKDLDGVLRGIYDAMDKADLKRIADLYGYDLSKPSDQLDCVEEYMASIAEQDKKPAAWDRLVRWIRRALTRMGFALKPTKGDVDGMIQDALGKARKYVERGESPVVTGYKNGRAMFKTTAWHGSPSKHDKFSTDYIGTGEGAQAYGYGLYFAGKKSIGKYYQEALGSKVHTMELGNTKYSVDEKYAEASPEGRVVKRIFDSIDKGYTPEFALSSAKTVFKNSPAEMDVLKDVNTVKVYSENKGHLYEVELAPDDDEYLLWDKPLSEQSEKVKDALVDSGVAKISPMSGKVVVKDGTWLEGKISGKDLYDRLISVASQGTKDDIALDSIRDNLSRKGWTEKDLVSGNTEKAISQYLHSLGIRGIKYLDGTSRGRPLKDIKKAFLDALPEDANFDDVMDLVGKGHFTTEQENVLKALDADDWFGFDYPAQAISAALGDMKSYDPSKALIDAVNELSKDATYNYVLFSDEDVSIKARFRKKAVTDTPEFKKWFGDSKVVDENGDPLVVYHGTADSIEAFSDKEGGRTTSSQSAKMGFFFTKTKELAETYADFARPKDIDSLKQEYERLEKKARKTGKSEDWKAYEDAYVKYEDAELNYVGDRPSITVDAYLSLNNPFIYDYKGEAFRDESYADLIDKAKKNGHDGVIFKNTYDGNGDPGSFSNPLTDVYVAFSPTQIKSVDNQGTFDPNNPDIRFRLKEADAAYEKAASSVLSKLSDKSFRDRIYTSKPAILARAAARYIAVRPAKILMRDAPKAGAQAVRIQRRVEMNARKLKGKWESILDKASEGLTKADRAWIRDKMFDLYQGGAKMPNARIQAFADAWEKISNEVISHARKLGVMEKVTVGDWAVYKNGDRPLRTFTDKAALKKWMDERTDQSELDVVYRPNAKEILRPISKIEHYFSHILTYEAREALILQRGELFDAIVEASHIGGFDLKPLLDEVAIETKAKRNANLEHARQANIPTVVEVNGKEVKILETNPFELIQRHIEGTANRLSIIQEFGQEGAEKGFQDIYNRIRQESSSDTAEQWKWMWQEMNGTTRDMIFHHMPRALAHFGAGAQAYASAAMLSLASISNVISGPVPMAIRFGLGNTTKAWAKIAAHSIGRRFGVKMPETERFLEQFKEWGGWSKSTLRMTSDTEMLHEQAARYAETAMKWLGMDAANRHLNKVANLAAHYAMTDAIESLRKGMDTGGLKALWGMDAKGLKEMLKTEGGWSDADLDRIIENGPTEDDAAQFIQRSSTMTNVFMESAETKPQAMGNGFWRRVFAYTSYFRMLGNTAMDTLSYAKKGNYRPLVMLLLGAPAMALLDDSMRDFLKGTVDQGESFAERFVGAVMGSGALGLPGTWYKSFKWWYRDGDAPFGMPVLEWYGKLANGVCKSAQKSLSDDYDADEAAFEAYRTAIKSSGILRVADNLMGGPYTEYLEDRYGGDGQAVPRARSSRRGR